MIRKTKDERKRVAERKIQSAVRFRQVIDLLSSEKKLIRMNKSSTSLSSAFSSLYPQVEVPSRGSDLFLQQRVKIDAQVDDVRCSNWNTGGKHEAGYDAFVTGCGFAQACSHLGFDFAHHSDNIAQNEKLEKYISPLRWLLTVFISAGQVVTSSTYEQAIVMHRTGESQSLNTRISSSSGTSHENCSFRLVQELGSRNSLQIS
ncbi:hypothetical protein Bca52824_081692 [Brassica carinata]|uniref:Uncharacterized protein n=1 Tax=Brassica carinata TaxID=52824 RepID=A0A8X7TTH3_BRACI|nr:hypothetical protein Bca52824_081692 [Brassica carinata]